MTLLLVLLGVSVAVEVLLFGIRPIWAHLPTRRVLSGISVLLISFASAGLIMLHPSVFTGLLFAVSAYRIINLLRMAKARMHEAYLYRTTRKTGLWLGGGQAALFAAWAYSELWSVPAMFWVGLVVFMQTSAATVLLLSTIRRLRHTRLAPVTSSTVSEHLPTLTVAIPARNETDELEECLRSIVHSDYPKLEIIVLDDCSQTKRTPAILRDFAHAGVRFLQGEPPREGWLAKNQAYDQLAKAANGELILFCGVDIRFEPHGLRELVNTLQHKNKRMMCYLPMRKVHERPQFALMQAVRYMWELSPPRKLFRRPPVLSSCWMIFRQDLHKFGGFSAVSRAIVPEAHFARQAIKSSDGYGFARAGVHHGVTSTKSLAAQRQTAIRTRYPSLHRRPEMVAIITASELGILLGSFVLSMLGMLGLVPAWVTLIAGLSALCFVITYSLVAIATRTNSWFFAPLLAPLSVVTDVVLMHRSMWQYEFSEVVWKGRNVCLPVMHVYAKLPETDS